MLVTTAWEQTPYYDPTNPNQIVREAMVGTGGDRGYASFYWNQVPFDGKTLSPSGAFGLALPQSKLALAGIGIGVAAAAGALTYFLSGRKRRR